VPPGLAFGRLGNFINASSGKADRCAWAMFFRKRTTCRATFAALSVCAGRCAAVRFTMAVRAPAAPGRAVSGLFLIGYGSFRFLADSPANPMFLGILSFGMSMGQWLSLPM